MRRASFRDCTIETLETACEYSILMGLRRFLNLYFRVISLGLANENLRES